MTPYELEKTLENCREIKRGLTEGASVETKLSLVLHMMETLLQHEADKEGELNIERHNRT